MLLGSYYMILDSTWNKLTDISEFVEDAEVRPPSCKHHNELRMTWSYTRIQHYGNIRPSEMRQRFVQELMDLEMDTYRNNIIKVRQNKLSLQLYPFMQSGKYFQLKAQLCAIL